MAPILKKFAGGAIKTSISSAAWSNVLPGAGDTFTVVSANGYPTTGDFVIVIGRGTVFEETVLIDGPIAGTTWTVGERGFDDTTAVAHASGSTIEHELDAETMTAIADHIDNSGSTDDHIQYMHEDGLRHDLTARHTVGTVLPADVPEDITPDDVATEGTATTVARADHLHGIAMGTPGSILPDDAAAEGVAVTFARADHKHAIATAAPIAVGTALSEGVGTSFARDDHVHELGTGSIDGLALFVVPVLPVVVDVANPTWQDGILVSRTDLDRLHIGIAGSVFRAKDINFVDTGFVDVALVAASAATGLITYNVTFVSAPIVMGTIHVGSNADFIVNWQSAPTSGNVAYRVFQKDGNNFTGTVRVNWMAVGPVAG